MCERVTEKNYYTKKSHTDYSLEAAKVISAIDLLPMGKKEIWWAGINKKNGETIVNKRVRELMEKYNGIYRGNSESKVIYLTFDEGYENGYTEKILEILNKKGVKAAFFITGWYLESQEKLVKRMIDEGHTVGNHSIRHYTMPLISNTLIVYEILELHMRVKERTGYDMRYFRPPEGAYNERVLAAASMLGYKNLFWSYGYNDWNREKQNGKNYAYKKVTENLHNGEILLLHAVSKDNADALEEILDFALNAGYRFEELDNIELLTGDNNVK